MFIYVLGVGVGVIIFIHCFQKGCSRSRSWTFSESLKSESEKTDRLRITGQEGVIRTTLHSREKMPLFKSKRSLAADLKLCLMFVVSSNINKRTVRYHMKTDVTRSSQGS